MDGQSKIKLKSKNNSGELHAFIDDNSELFEEEEEQSITNLTGDSSLNSV